jgi:hypothetical protein
MGPGAAAGRLRALLSLPSPGGGVAGSGAGSVNQASQQKLNAQLASTWWRRDRGVGADLEVGPAQKYPQAARVWEGAWDDFTPFLPFTPPVRKLLYTTNSIVISSLN